MKQDIVIQVCHLDYVSPRRRYRGGNGNPFFAQRPDYSCDYYRFRAYRRTYPISLDRLYRGFQSHLLVLKNLRNHVSENLKEVYQILGFRLILLEQRNNEFA